VNAPGKDSSVDEDEERHHYPCEAYDSFSGHSEDKVPLRGLRREDSISVENLIETLTQPHNNSRRNLPTRHLRRELSSRLAFKENSVRDISASLVMKKQMSRRGIRFSDEIDTKQISFLHKSAIEDLFYHSEDFADFRYKAFMEDCGLDPNDFD
jgi:hypothetical protein